MNSRITYSLLGFFIGLLTLSVTPVLAEELVGEFSVSEEASSTASTTVDSEVTTNKERWFKVEQLSGLVNQGDFVVGPGRVELELKPGQSAVYEVSLANRIDDNRSFSLVFEDVAGTEDAKRSVIFLGEERGPYTVKDYLSVPENSLKLNLGERARIPVTISVPEDAEPGGYYGGLLISTIKDDGKDEGPGTARSPIVARVGTLFFITVPGEVVKSGETKAVSVLNKKWWYEKGPINMAVLFENTGSVHLNPYGEARIKNIFGEEVGFVELEPWFVLPKSLRSREFSWDRELLFGRYTVFVSINRGYDDIIDEYTLVFWVLPWKVLLATFLGIFTVIFGLRLFFKKFEFTRRA
jgi:hypothetical protein